MQYVKVDIRTNKPLNGHFRFRLSCRLRYRYRQQTRFVFVLKKNIAVNRKKRPLCLMVHDNFVSI